MSKTTPEQHLPYISKGDPRKWWWKGGGIKRFSNIELLRKILYFTILVTCLMCAWLALLLFTTKKYQISGVVKNASHKESQALFNPHQQILKVPRE